MKAVLSQSNAERAFVFVLAWFGAAPVLISFVDASREMPLILRGLAWSGALLPFPFLPFLIALPSEEEE